MPSNHSSASDDQPIDIGGRTYQLYWCHQCHRAIRIASNNPPIMCPGCFHRFVYEIDVARPRLMVEFSEFDPSPEARLLEALSLMLYPHVPLQVSRTHERFTDVGIQTPWRRRSSNSRFDDNDMNGWGLESGILARSRPQLRSWIVFTPHSLPRVPNGSNHNSNEPEGAVPRGVDPRNYYAGSELNELIEELTQNDQPGPPPAPDSAINGLPNVKITQTHLLNDSQSCAICMEDFNIGGEAKELPCNHIFHSNCIVPWLRLHNSCPVCRTQLPLPTITTSDSSDDGMDFSVDSRGRRQPRRCSRWRRSLSVWPSQQGYQPLGSHGDNNVTARNNLRMNTCNIL
ncbi:putative transcription factor C2H2 family [Helianthus anomalus]